MLQAKAKKAYLNEATLIRMLVKGLEPKEKPGDDFYNAMNLISEFGNKVNEVSEKMRLLGNINYEEIKVEVKRWHEFQADIEEKFLRPDRSNLKWQ